MSGVNFNNVDACRSAWINYHYENNTNGISESDIKEIETRYSTQLRGWKLEVSKDHNSYEIDDDTQKKPSSRSNADLAGAITTSMGGVVATHAANKAAINGILNTGYEFVGGTPSASALGSQTFAELGTDGSLSTTTSAAQKANNTSAIGFMVECTLGLATGVLYQASKPNKDEHAELMDLEGQMEEYLSTLDEEQVIMAEDAEKTDDISESAQNVSADTTETLEQLQKEYEEKLARQQQLAAKIESGEPLTEEEQAEYEQLGIYLAELSEKMSAITEDTTDKIGDLTQEAGEVQGDLESTAATVEDIQTTADYAESFDKGTQTMCKIESVAQGLNVASSTKGAVSAFSFANSGALLFGSTLWANVFGAMGLEGAALSLVGMAEQIKMSVDIGKEIDVRDKVQSLNTEVAGTQADTAEALQTTSEDINDAEMVIDDIEIPEPEATVPPESPTNPEDEDKKPED